MMKGGRKIFQIFQAAQIVKVEAKMRTEVKKLKFPFLVNQNAVGSYKQKLVCIIIVTVLLASYCQNTQGAFRSNVYVTVHPPPPHRGLGFGLQLVKYGHWRLQGDIVRVVFVVIQGHRRRMIVPFTGTLARVGPRGLLL